MICPECQTANRDQANFCRRCGSLLVDHCPRCDVSLLPDSDFCDNCGRPLTPATAAGWTVKDDMLRAEAGKLAGPPSQGSGAQAAYPPATVHRTQPDAPSQNLGGSLVPHLDQYIPKELREKLNAARAQGGMVGERRVVTMLFCDVKGSTAAAEQLDPEEWTEIINGAFEHMIKPVYRYEGTVARLMGDGILAFFGAPIAHEDDPQRAVLAGLDIVAGLGPYREEVRLRNRIDFDVRVGINTGTVVVGTVGSDLRMEYTAMGDAVNLAARMEQTAQPGTVQIAEETHRLVAPLFEIEDLGSIEVKGKAKPVAAYRALERKAIPGRLRGLDGMALPMVGRERARYKLSVAMEQVLNGNGQIVCITGDVGLGKSRLIEEQHREWEKALGQMSSGADEQSQNSARWFETFSLSYETTRPYSLFKHLLRQVCGATQGDPPAILRQKLATFISEIVPTTQQDQVTRVLESLFGLRQENGGALEGETFKTQLYETITSLVSLWFKDTPGVIVCDDVQWSDPASVDLLMHLFQLSDRLPLLIICALRPDRQSPGWQIKTTADREFHYRYTEIQLEPLSKEESLTLVSRLLNNDQLPESLRESILAKAAGNPFFIEEVVRALIDGESVLPRQNGEGWELSPGFESGKMAIPDSLQSLLMARIDRLDESQRHTLQLAALIGRSFYYRVLKLISQVSGESEDSQVGMLDRHLGDLQRMELITQAARLPELEFIFRQALVQESAYKTILHKQRREYHRKVGEALESLFPEHLDEHTIMLAHHYTEAGDYERALKYHTLAADTAYRLYANTEAVEHYTQALEAAENSSATSAQLIHLRARRGRALELNARLQEAVENYETMRREALQLGAEEMQLAALVPLATLYCTPTSIYNLELGESLSQQALQLAQDLENKPAEAKILWNLLNVNRFSGRTQEALEYGERALTIARELDLREQIAFTLNDLCHLYNRIGQYDMTKTALQETQVLWRELDNLPMLADSLSTASYVYTFTGDYDQAIAYSEEALRTSEAIQNIWGISYSQWVIPKVYWERGAPDRAIQVMKDSIYYSEKAGFVVAQVYTRSDLAIMYAELGDVTQGLEIAQQAMTIAEKSHLQLLPYNLSQLARIHLMNENPLAAEQAVEAVRIDDRPIHLNLPDMPIVAECELLLHRGEFKEAIHVLQQRLEALRSYGLKAFLPETMYLLGKAQRQAGHLNEAISTLEEGLKVSRSLGARWMEWQILAALAGMTTGKQAVRRQAEALEIVNAIAENVSASDLHQSFINRPDVKKLMESELA